MEFSEPIAGEMAFGEVDAAEEQLVGAAEAIIERLDALIAQQQMQQQMLAMLAQQLQAGFTAKRVVLRDESGRVIGSEPV